MRKHIIIIALVVILASCLKPGKVEQPAQGVTPDKWYALKVGEALNLTGAVYVMRVPGGWVWRSKVGRGECCAFIPMAGGGE